MATNTSICGICSLRQITQTSNHWCPQCEEALCDECRDHHKLLKVTRSHEPMPILDYKSIPSFITDIEETCVYHNEHYQQYCVEHSLPICYKCINDHRKCNVITLEKVTINIKTSEKFLDLESRLEDLIQNIDRIKKDRNDNMADIEETKTRLVKEIRQKKAEINERLDNLEKQIIKDLEQKECESKESIQKVLSSVKEKETMVIKCQTDFQSIKQYASDLQTFLGINETEVQIYEKEQYLQSLKKGKSLEHLDLVWKVHPVVQSISSSLQNFGSTEIKIRSSHIEFTRAKDKQAQLQVLTTKENIDDVKLKRPAELVNISRKVPNRAAADTINAVRALFDSCQARTYQHASGKTETWKVPNAGYKLPISEWTPKREKFVWQPSKMNELKEMGFCNHELNEKLLKKHNDDVKSVVQELLTTENDWKH